MGDDTGYNCRAQAYYSQENVRHVRAEAALVRKKCATVDALVQKLKWGASNPKVRDSPMVYIAGLAVLHLQ
jgi:hypothetical protein